MGKAGRIVGWVLHVLIAGMMILAGVMKVFNLMPPEAAKQMGDSGIADHLFLIGAGELTAGVLMLVPVTSSLGVLLTSGFWGGVICLSMHQREGFVFPSVMLALTWLGAYLRDPRTFASFTGRSVPAAPVAPEVN